MGIRDNSLILVYCLLLGKKQRQPMSSVTVSDKGQVVIPAAIRRRLGIVPGSKLDFELEGDSVRVRLCKSIPQSRAEDGFGLLRCDRPGVRHLTDFDAAALPLAAAGLDFADALHLTGSAHCTALYTFDGRRFADTPGPAGFRAFSCAHIPCGLFALSLPPYCMPGA
jgi:antitoxin PrlF